MKTANFDDEATRLEVTDNQPAKSGEANKDKTAATAGKKLQSGKVDWKGVASGAATGVLIGTLSSTLMGMKSAGGESAHRDVSSDNHKDELSHPEWVDNEVQVATSVSDNMSFGQAFAAARAEVGPGGCFEWHGRLYGTYTAEEWNSMSADERADYGDHFSWNHVDRTQSDVAPHSSSAADQSHGFTSAATDDDVEVVSVNHNDARVQNTTQTDDSDAELEVIGVVHDAETGINSATVSVDGQMAVIVDIDGDMTFDYLVSDENGDGHIDENEISDISDINLTVDSFGGFSDQSGEFIAGGDDPDYSSESLYEA